MKILLAFALLLIVPILFLGFLMIGSAGSQAVAEQNAVAAQAQAHALEAMRNRQVLRQANDQRVSEINKRLARLEGLALFDKNPKGDLRLALPFREVYGVREEVAAELAKTMQEVVGEYTDELRARTNYQLVGAQAIRVTVAGFPELDTALGNRFFRKARALLKEEAFEAIATFDPLHAELVVDARVDVLHEIQRTKGGLYTWISRRGDSVDQGSSQQLPEELAAYWSEVFEPLPPSTVSSLEAFLEVVAELASDEVRVELTEIDAKRSRRPQPELPVRLEVSASIYADSIDSAARVLDRLKARLQERGATVTVGSTQSIVPDSKEAGNGLLVKDLRIVRPVQCPPALLPAWHPSEDLTGNLRSLSHESEGIGAVDIRSSSHTHDARYSRRTYYIKLDQVRAEGGSLTRIADWLRKIEDLDEHSVVGLFSFDRRGEGWDLMIEVDTRESA